MTLIEIYHAEHKARLARMAPKPKPKPIIPYPYNMGWEGMWFYDLVNVRPITPYSPTIKVKEIQRAVIDHFKMTKVEFFSRRRTRNIVWPRQVAMYLCKTLTTRSLPEIGRKFGGKDHTTVLHAVRKVELQVAEDDEIREEIAAIRRAIR